MHLTTKLKKNLQTSRPYLWDLSISIFLVLALALHIVKIFSPAINFWTLIVAVVFGVSPIFKRTILNIMAGEWASMDMLASVALVFSLVTAQWASATFICLMILSAYILEEINEERTKKSIKGLLKLRPENAKVEKNGIIKVVAVDQVAVGDIVIVDNGERIPIDGVVISGEAYVDESSLTGESLPVEKGTRQKVSSSTLVVSGSIKIRTEKIGKDTTLERIIALVEYSRKEKPETQTLGENFGKIYLISIFIGAAVALLITKNVYFVLALVLVVCADDVAVAIPIAYLRAIGFAAHIGIIVKSGKRLEMLGDVDIIVFDKTGTLTMGKPDISAIVAGESFDEEDVLKIGSIAASRSSHPLAKTLVAHALEAGLPEIFPDSAEVVSGRGVIAIKDKKQIILGNRAFFEKYRVFIPKDLELQASVHVDRGESISFVARDQRAIGFFAVSDKPKINAKHVVERLKKLGIKKVVMLTGDNEKVASVVANELGIENYYANLLPENKVDILRKLQKEGKVAMVGDGVNDAASLSISDVGIAMGALGTDGAIESAEIVLMRDDLSAIPKIIKLARKVHKIAVQDFWLWGLSNGLGLVLVFSGLMGPVGAAAYNFLSDFFPLFNSLRAKIR